MRPCWSTVSVGIALVLVAILLFVVFLFFLLFDDVSHHWCGRLPLGLPRAPGAGCRSHELDVRVTDSWDIGSSDQIISMNDGGARTCSCHSRSQLHGARDKHVALKGFGGNNSSTNSSAER